MTFKMLIYIFLRNQQNTRKKFDVTVDFRKLLNIRNEFYASVLKLVNRQDLKSCGW